MVYQLRIYVFMHSPGYICLGLVLGRLPYINLFGVHYRVICCVVETKFVVFHWMTIIKVSWEEAGAGSYLLVIRMIVKNIEG